MKITEGGFAQEPDLAKFNKRPTAAIYRYDELLRSHSALQACELRQTIRSAGS